MEELRIQISVVDIVLYIDDRAFTKGTQQRRLSLHSKDAKGT